MVQLNSVRYPRGLDYNSNPLVGTPSKDQAGGRQATTVADNCILTRQRMIGNRRGFRYSIQNTVSPIDYMDEYQAEVIQHQQDNTLWHGAGQVDTRSQYTGSYPPPTGYSMDSTVAAGSFFFTTANGVMKLDAVGNTPVRSGMPKGLEVRSTLVYAPTGFLGPFNRVAYHVTWLRQDATAQQIRGDVSTRLIVTNSTQVALTSLTSAASVATATTVTPHVFNSGDTVTIAGATQGQYNGSFVITKTGASTFTYPVSGSPTSPATTATVITAGQYANVSLTFTVPADVTTADWFEVWRTQQVDASNVDPGDTCYLVAKVQNTFAALATATYVDSMADSVLTANTPLYTNPSQNGALAGAARPPTARVIEAYKDYTLYANAGIDCTLNLNIVAVLNFVANTSSITLTGTVPKTYVASTIEDIPTRKWQIATSSTNAKNIELTVRSLCHVISGDPTGQWYAEYIAGPNDQPGLFRVWARSPASGTFSVTANNTTTGNQFLPVLPTSGTTVSGSDDYRANRIFYSQPGSPEWCPILNTIDVGRRDQPIYKLVACRDCCFVLKGDGVFYLSGLNAPFSLVELDSTCHIIAPRTAVMLNNTVFCLSNQGVVKISLSGVTVVSFDLEPAIMVTTIRLANLASVAFGVSHEADRAYLLFLPISAADTAAQYCFVYNTFIEEWTKWLKPAYAGYVLSTNYMAYLSSGLEPALLRQRKIGDSTDFSDEEIAITISAVSSPTITFTWTSSVFTPQVGMSVHQGAEIAKVLAINGTLYTLDRTSNFVTGAATVRMPIVSHVRLSPQSCGDIGIVKQLYSVVYVLEGDTVTQAKMELATNEAPQLLAYPMSRLISGGWGSSWGGTSWGDTVSPVRNVPWELCMPVPDMTGESVVSGWFHNVSTEQFIIAQISIAYDPLSEYESVR